MHRKRRADRLDSAVYPWRLASCRTTGDGIKFASEIKSVGGAAGTFPFVGALGLRVLPVPRGLLFWWCFGGTLVLPTPHGVTVSLAMPRGGAMIRWCLARRIRCTFLPHTPCTMVSWGAGGMPAQVIVIFLYS